MYKNEVAIDAHVLDLTTAAGMNGELHIDKLQQLENDERIKIITTITGLDMKQVTESLKRIAEFFADVVKAFKKALGVLFEFQEFVEQVDFEEIHSQQQEKRELYKLNFERLRIQHQVLDRKPRHLIKKVIR